MKKHMEKAVRDVLCQTFCTHQVKYKCNTPLFQMQLPMLSLWLYINTSPGLFINV